MSLAATQMAGATVESAAKALISAGARNVDVLALAKVVRAD